jgi:hypothetical protein
VGVVDSLSAGYRFLLHRLELLLIPLLLDLILWALPRLSIEPILTVVADFYAGTAQEAAAINSEMAEMTEQIALGLRGLGESVNLLNLLANGALFHVPSLMATVPGLKAGHGVFPVDSFGGAAGYAVIIGALGLLIGVLFMNHLALALPIGESDKSRAPGDLASRVLRHWQRTLLFLVGLAVALTLFYVPASIGAGLLLLLNPFLGSLAMFFFSSLSLVIFFYLYFVTAGLVLDDLPVWPAVVRSATLVRGNFWVTLGFVVLTNLISLGIGMLVIQMASTGMAGLLFALPFNAFINTGLAMALLVFYRTRLLKDEGKEQGAGF